LNDLRERGFGSAAAFSPSLCRRVLCQLCALRFQRAFKLNQCGQRLPAGGDRRVDRIGQAAKIDAARLKLGDGLHQMNERAAEPVEFPHDQRITRFERGQRFAEAGPFGMGVADALVDEDALAACLSASRCKASVLSMIETRA
jgi:hypothetical protein